MTNIANKYAEKMVKKTSKVLDANAGPATIYFGVKMFEPLIQSAIDESTTEMRERKDRAYLERNKLVAILCKLFPSSLERHPEEDLEWKDDWRWVVYIDLPTGQVSWHLHDSQLGLFDHVDRLEGREWDGHTTEIKYERCQNYIDTGLSLKEIDSIQQGQIEELVGLLKEIEWSGGNYEDCNYFYCPECGELEKDGKHTDICGIGELIARHKPTAKNSL